MFASRGSLLYRPPIFMSFVTWLEHGRNPIVTLARSNERESQNCADSRLGAVGACRPNRDPNLLPTHGVSSHTQDVELGRTPVRKLIAPLAVSAAAAFLLSQVGFAANHREAP